MSNQRAGKTYRAAADDGSQDRKIYDLVKLAADVTENTDIEASFCFEQLAEHIRDGKPLPRTFNEMCRVLGV